MIMYIIVMKRITKIVIKEGIVHLWIKMDMMIGSTKVIVDHIDSDPGMILVEKRPTSGLSRKKKLERDTLVIRKVLVQVLRQVQVQTHPVHHQATDHKANLLK